MATYSTSFSNSYRVQVITTVGTYNAAGNYTPITFELRADANTGMGFAQWECQGYLNVVYRNAAGASNISRRVFTEDTGDKQWITANGTGTTYSAGGYLTAYKATLNCYHDENGYLEIDFTGNYGMVNQSQSYSMPVLTLNVSPIAISDQSIPAVATTASIIRYENTFVAGPVSTPTSSTGGTQTFTTYIRKNGGDYLETTQVSAIATDYASAVVVSTFDGNLAQSPVVSISGVPFAPAAPTISNALTTNLTLSWAAPATNGSAITSYIIQATTDDGANWTDLYTGVTTTTKNVTNLTIAATYKFRIIAVSAVGNSANGTASVAQFISAYGYRYTSPTAKTAVVSAARYTGSSSDSIVLNGTTYTGWKQVANIKKYQSGTWSSLET
jgi:archaellum component FlaG (FlaF/FlaG flagellin family)